MAQETIDLFTNEEHAIISDWLDVDPQTCDDELPGSSDALEALGFIDKASAYSEYDAAVAAIVLERIQGRLPQWGAVRHEPDGEAVVVLGRDIRDRLISRTVEMVPRHLLTINWADSGPGFSWPVAYHVTWLPFYDEFVVTQSADCPDAFGYCDFAIGHFPADTEVVSAAVAVVEADWQWQNGQFGHGRRCIAGSTLTTSTVGEAIGHCVRNTGTTIGANGNTSELVTFIDAASVRSRRQLCSYWSSGSTTCRIVRSIAIIG